MRPKPLSSIVRSSEYISSKYAKIMQYQMVEMIRIYYNILAYVVERTNQDKNKMDCKEILHHQST